MKDGVTLNELRQLYFQYSLQPKELFAIQHKQYHPICIFLNTNMSVSLSA